MKFVTVGSKFTPKVPKVKTLSNASLSRVKTVEIVELPTPILVCLSKEVLKKSRFFDKEKKLMSTNKVPQRQLYAQVAGSSILEIVKLKKNYSKLLAQKI